MKRVTLFTCVNVNVIEILRENLGSNKIVIELTFCTAKNYVNKELLFPWRHRIKILPGKTEKTDKQTSNIVSNNVRKHLRNMELLTKMMQFSKFIHWLLSLNFAYKICDTLIYFPSSTQKLKSHHEIFSHFVPFLSCAFKRGQKPFASLQSRYWRKDCWRNQSFGRRISLANLLATKKLHWKIFS